VLQQLWAETYRLGATGSAGAYAGRSYWVCTYNWVNQDISYPVSTPLYIDALTSGFSTGGTPTFAIIGFNNKVYFDSSTLNADETFVNNFTTALNLAIDEFVREGLYVNQPIEDRYFNSDFNEDIDLTNVFAEFNDNPFTINILENFDPSVVNVSLTGNLLTISGNGGKEAETIIRIQAVSGDFSVTDDFKVTISDPTSFLQLIQGFEVENFPPPFWNVKYNTLTDGGLSGSNLKDPTSTVTWEKNDASTPLYGADYIHSGDNSALIVYNAPDFNWLISPYMQLDYNDYVLKFWICYTNTTLYSTKFHVLIDDGVKGWVSILDWNEANSTNLYENEISLSLSDFYNKTIRAAFVYEYTDGYEVAVDDIVISSPSRIDNNSVIPTEIKLYQNYPNPFNPTTKINFSIPETSLIKLFVFNQKGEIVKSLFEGKLEKGNHTYDFNGMDLTSGVFYYKLETGTGSFIKKMIMLK